jgi:hypothetical protein
MLQTGRRIEVKAVRRDARTVRINSLAQLDPGNDPLHLAIVRMEDTGPNADGAVTALLLVDRIKARVAADPEALASFGTSLAFAGWHDNPKHQAVVVRVLSIERYDIDQGFPRLTKAAVPEGIQDADYTIVLPVVYQVLAEIIQ